MESEPVPDAETLEERSLGLYRSRQFDAAIQDFRKYLAHYPDESQKIQWFLAQALYERGNWGEASKEFRKLVGSPNPENRADALLKLGMIDEKKGDWESAQTRWNRVVKTYPQTKAAARARSFLAAKTPNAPNYP
jgi:tol-pal system protein YbgF